MLLNSVNKFAFNNLNYKVSETKQKEIKTRQQTCKVCANFKKPSPELLRISFAGLQPYVYKGIKEGFKVPEAVVQVCQQKRMCLAGKATIVNKIRGMPEDAFIVCPEEFGHYFILNRAGKLVGFNKCERAENPFENNLRIETQGNITSSRFEERQFPNEVEFICCCFDTAKDKYGEVGPLCHFIAVALREKLGLTGDISLSSLESAKSFHEGFGYKVDSLSLPLELSLPYCPESRTGQFCVSDIQQRLRRDPILLQSFVHPDDVRADMVYR